MATRNGVCPYCQIPRLDHRLFLVNPEASTAFCPHCMREINPKEAINLYNEIIEKMIKKADDSLFVAGDPVSAYQQYADVLEVEKENSNALLGRILCLIYTSKIKHSYLVEANDLLSNIEHKGVDAVNVYVGFLKRINYAIDEYDLALQNKLTYRKYYYDEECIRVYLTRLSEIIKFKKDILDKLIQIKKDYLSQNNEVLINLLAHNITEKENVLKANKFTLNGTGYKCIKINKGKVELETLSEKINLKNIRYIPHTLDENSKNGRAVLIKDIVFKDYTPIIRAKKIAIPFLVLLFLAAVACGLVAFFYHTHKIIFPACIGAGTLAFLGFIILLVLFSVWSVTLKKRKLRKD